MQANDSAPARLVVLVQRLIDADLITEAQAQTLLEEATASLCMWRADQTAEALLHAHRVELFVEALIQTRALSPTDGHSVLTLTREMRGK